MAILTAADKDIYFPDVCQTGDGLAGLILRAENFLQSAWGTDRPIEKQQFTEHRDFGRVQPSDVVPWYQTGLQRGHPNYRCLWLQNFPVELVDPAPVIRYRGRSSGFGRAYVLDWQTLDAGSYELLENGRLDLGMALEVTALEVTYTAGYDFTAETPDTITMKIAAGLILQRLARTDPDATKNQDLTLEPLHQYFQSVLLPVQRYRRRTGVG